MAEKSPTLFHFLAAEFEKAEIPFLLVGGFAVNYYQATRFTADVDLLTMDENFERASRILGKEGYQCIAKNNLFARFESSDPNAMDLDIMFVDKKTMSGILKEAKEAEIRGDKFRVPSLNHLIALKLHSIKYNPENREYRDLWDIVELIKRNRVNFRSEEFKQLCLEYGPEQIYEKITGALASWKS